MTLPFPKLYDPAKVGQLYLEDAARAAEQAKEYALIHRIKPAARDTFRIAAFGIDAQIGFCIPGASLFVPGAVEDTRRSIEAAKEKGGYATGYVGDMSGLGPETVLASIVWNMQPIFDRLIEQTAAGNFQGEFIRYGVKEGALDIALNPKLGAGLEARIEDARRRAGP